MLAKIRPSLLLLFLAFFWASQTALPGAAAAQFFSSPGDQDGFVESDGPAFEQEDRQGGDFGPEQFGVAPGSGGEGFSGDDRFVDEGGPQAPEREGGVTITRRRTQLRLQGERDTLPLNTAWGAGTGLVIGSWFAFIEGGSDRETQRFIGMGVVLGALLGVTLGMKTVINPAAPSSAMAPSPKSPPGVQATPLVALAGGRTKSLLMGVSLRF